MYAISLTTIPPRLPQLGLVLDSLLTQDTPPDQIYLCLPETWDRFPGAFHLPKLPAGVSVLTSETDLGPATKVVPAARRTQGRYDKLIYCDDDWVYPTHWARHLLDAQGNEQHAVAASGFPVTRLGRRYHGAPPAEGFSDIAQGFGGVLVNPSWLAGPDAAPPAPARSVDDIWLSGQLARQNIPLRLCPAARTGLKLALEDNHGLQDAKVDGLSRAEANQSALTLLTRAYGIWPARQP